MHWSKAGANDILRLRAGVRSGVYDHFWCRVDKQIGTAYSCHVVQTSWAQDTVQVSCACSRIAIGASAGVRDSAGARGGTA